MSDLTRELRRATWAAVGVAVLLIGQQLAGKALRDGFFLSNFEASALPAVMTTASVLSVAIVLGSTRMFQRFAPARTLPIFFLGSALLFTAEWAASGPYPRIAAVSLYLHTTSFGAVVVSGFWSIVNERFDPHTAKRVVGRIAGGATLGGVLGGLAAWGGAESFPIATMILMLAAANVFCAIGVRGIGAPTRRPAAERAPLASESSAFEILAETPYLRHVALLVGLAAFSSALYDYVFKARAAAHYDSGAELVAFFGLFYLSIGVLTFLVQNLFARRSLALLGLAITVSTLPGAIILCGIAALFIPGISTAALLRGGPAVAESSLYRSGYELLYTPVLPAKKRPTKTLIDVGGDKLGAAIGGIVAFFMIGIFPQAANGLLICIGIAAGLAGVSVTRQLHRGYVASLAESLRSGGLDLSQAAALDATTKRTVEQTLVAMERSDVLERTGLSSQFDDVAGNSRDDLVEWLRSTRVARNDAMGAVGIAHEPYTATPDDPIATAADPILAAIGALRSGAAKDIERVLQRNDPLPEELVPHVVPLLEHSELARAASAALVRVAPAHVGVLLDAALYRRTPLEVRRQVCALLAAVPTERTAYGLSFLLRDEEFDLRFASALALLEIHRANPRAPVRADAMYAAAETEARASLQLWRRRTLVSGHLVASPPLDSPSGRRVVQGLAYIYTLLLSLLEREPLELAIRALAHDHAGHRGTGLEYLDNVLPADLKQSLWPLLEDGRLTRATLRPQREILAEIIDETPASEVDLAALRERIDAQRLAAQRANPPDGDTPDPRPD